MAVASRRRRRRRHRRHCSYTPPTPFCVLHTLAHPTRRPHRCSRGVYTVYTGAHCRRRSTADNADNADDAASVRSVAFRVADRWLATTHARSRAAQRSHNGFCRPTDVPSPCARQSAMVSWRASRLPRYHSHSTPPQRTAHTNTRTVHTAPLL